MALRTAGLKMLLASSSLPAKEKRGDMEFVSGHVAMRDHVKNGKDLHLFASVRCSAEVLLLIRFAAGQEQNISMKRLVEPFTRRSFCPFSSSIPSMQRQSIDAENLFALGTQTTLEPLYILLKKRSSHIPY